MTKPSVAYRNDNLGNLPEDVKQYLDEHFLEKLPNLRRLNPKLLIVFSGGNGVGKTTLARNIEHALQALVLENDRIKTCLLQFNPALKRNELNTLTWQYTMDLYQRLDTLTANGLVVRDGVIDWYYDRILPLFKAHHYPVFVIGYDISRSKRQQLIKQRGNKTTVSMKQLMQLMDEHDDHIAQFRAHHSLDIRLTDEDMFDHGKIIDAIKSRLENIL